MRRRRLLWAWLLLALTGCVAGPPARSGNWLERLQNAQAALVTDGVLLDVVLIERPAGDHFLNKELWTSTDEHVLPLQQKLLLEDNGFRVGQVVGMVPERLQTLLTSDRYCISRWRQILPAGKSVPVTLARPTPELRYRIVDQGQATEVALEQAQGLLVVVPTLTADGRTTLRFTPEVQFGKTVPNFKVLPDRSDWDLSYRRPCKAHPELSWEVTVAPNTYVVIGAVVDRPERLGHVLFLNEDEDRPVQRLLVIRTTRSLPSMEMAEFSHSSKASPAPLAVQASWSSISK